MVILRSKESFKPDSEDWNTYSKCLEQYVIANDIKDENKLVTMSSTTTGSKNYNLLRDLLAQHNHLKKHLQRW